jgi:molybdenum cofactor cytidylyltransferase
MSGKQNSAVGLGIAGVVLAAGASRRLGRPKQLVELNGAPLLAWTLRAILAHCDRGVICVLGAHAADVRPALDGFDVQIVVNTDWREGIGASIRVGVERVPTDAQAILLAVCDQPLVCSADFARLIADWRIEPQAIAAAGYGNGHNVSYGVPAIFPAAYRGNLIGLRGDQGAKALIGGASRRRIVAMPNAAFDVDDKADLARLEEIAGQ